MIFRGLEGAQSVQIKAIFCSVDQIYAIKMYFE